jgi:carbamoyltransferase
MGISCQLGGIQSDGFGALWGAALQEHLIYVKNDGSFWMDQSYFNCCAGMTMTTDKFHRLFGGLPKKPETFLTQRDMDLAASVQVVSAR